MKETAQRKSATANPASAPKSLPPGMDEQNRRQKQLEILKYFGTIDFDPDFDPLELRRRDRERTRRLN